MENKRLFGTDFTDLGYRLVKPEGIPAFMPIWKPAGRDRSAVHHGRLRSLICAEHPDCDPADEGSFIPAIMPEQRVLMRAAAAPERAGVLDGLCGSFG